MQDMIDKAEKAYLWRNAEKIKERAAQEELKAELHSRMASGEASLLIGKFRVKEKEDNLFLLSALSRMFSY